MKLHQHAEHTHKLHGIRGENIHLWIDAYFDGDRFRDYAQHGPSGDFNPYDHRQHRHCLEALEDAVVEFENRYRREDIKKVFETHLKDDYHGYLPCKKDFENPDFLKKYHGAHDADAIIASDLPGRREYLSQYLPESHPTRKKHRRNLFSAPITVPAILTVVLFIASIHTLILPILAESYMERKKEMCHELVGSAISILEELNGRIQSGATTSHSARNEAIDILSRMRYGKENKDYFWITDCKPIMLSHPFRADLIGKDMTLYHETESASGKNLFVEFVEVVQKEGFGYVLYDWQDKTDPSSIVPKLSYVELYKPWNWVVGTGVYVDDVQRELSAFSKRLWVITLGICMIMALLLFYINYHSIKNENLRLDAEKELSRSREQYRALVESSSEGVLLIQDGNIIYANPTFLKYNFPNGKQNELSLSALELNYIPDGKDSVCLDLMLEHLLGKDNEMYLSCNHGPWQAVNISATRAFFPGTDGFIVNIRDLQAVNDSASFYQPLPPGFGRSTSIYTELLHPDSLFFLNQSIEQLELNTLSCHINDTILSVIQRMTLQCKSSILVRGPDDIPIGIITDTDLRQRFFSQSMDLQQPACLFMSSPLLSLSKKISLYEASLTMQENSIQHLGVKNDAGSCMGLISSKSLYQSQQFSSSLILRDISNAQQEDEILAARSRMSEMAQSLLDSGVNGRVICRLIATINEVTVRKTIALAEARLGPPPHPYAFIALGSLSRKEQTLLTDQDNILILSDGVDGDAQAEKYFEDLSNYICDHLHHLGITHCKGKVMASNPECRLSLSSWKQRFAGWINNPQPKALMEMSVFFDLELIHGQPTLMSELQDFIFAELKKTPSFFIFFCEHGLSFKAPLSILGHLVGKKDKDLDEDIIHLKEALVPCVHFARTYALNNGIRESSTVQRLQTLQQMGVIDSRLASDLIQYFEYLLQLRIGLQVHQIRSHEKMNNLLKLSDLGEMDHIMLRNYFHRTISLQNKLRLDFKQSVD